MIFLTLKPGTVSCSCDNLSAGLELARPLEDLRFVVRTMLIISEVVFPSTGGDDNVPSLGATVSIEQF